LNLLITGGLGNLGLWLTHYFLDKGECVTVVGRTEKIIINNDNYKFITCDITKQDDLALAITEYYDFCIHAASYNEHFHSDYSEKALLINALGTDNLCKALLNSGIGKLIYLSTFHVYGSSSGEITEQSEIAPKNDYGLTHYFAEKYIEMHAQNNKLTYCTLRLTNSYGCPKDVNTDKWYLILNDLCKRAFEHNEIVLNSNGKGFRDFIWMGDVVNVIDMVMTSRRSVNTFFNLSSGKSLSIYEIAQFVQQAFKEVFNQDLPILIDCADKTESNLLTVNNSKLLDVIDVDFNLCIISEAKNIFKLLDNKNER
jgi:UDP-glucose 4-epimerase